MSNSRRKRASVQDIYKSCQLGGDCPEDVKNKVENTTLADRLLQILGSIVYFGQLGIGSGKGTGGVTGYRPLQNVRPSLSRVPETIRPNIPIDPIGGADIIPPVVIDATAPSVVPLSEIGTPDVNIISSGTGPTVELGELDIVTAVDPTITETGIPDHPAVIDVTDEGTSVIDVQTRPPPAKRLQLDTSLRPFEHIELTVFPHNSNTESNINIYVDTQFGGELVGADNPTFTDIELNVDDSVQRTSTPITEGKTIGRAKDLYNKYTQQIELQSLEAVSRPSRQVTFQFENPAFSEDVTLRFNQDVEEVTAAPNQQFADIAVLNRPRFGTTESGRVRLSRLGQKATMKTRSGLVIGEKVHYYYDLSTITEPETIELQTFSTVGHTSGDALIQDSLIEGNIIDVFPIETELYTNEQLLDIANEEFSNSQLVFSYTDEENNTVDTISLFPNSTFSLSSPLYNDTNVNWSTTSSISVPTIVPFSPIQPSYPIQYGIYGENFSLDPYLISRKRKRVALY